MNIKTFGTQKEAQVINISKPGRVLRYDIDYDTLHPEEVMRKFVSDVREMLARYDFVSARISEIENEMADIEHYMEISPYKTVTQGYKLYRKLAELRKERRACKDEKILLQNVYNRFKESNILNQVALCQGECGKGKGYIDNQVYTVKSDVLDDWLDDAPPAPIAKVLDVKADDKGITVECEKIGDVNLPSLKEVM